MYKLQDNRLGCCTKLKQKWLQTSPKHFLLWCQLCIILRPYLLREITRFNWETERENVSWIVRTEGFSCGEGVADESSYLHSDWAKEKWCSWLDWWWRTDLKCSKWLHFHISFLYSFKGFTNAWREAVHFHRPWYIQVRVCSLPSKCNVIKM